MSEHDDFFSQYEADIESINASEALEKPLKGSGSRTVIMKLGQGLNQVRLLPAKAGESAWQKRPYIHIYSHWHVGPLDEQVMCREMTASVRDGKTVSDLCYICEQSEALIAMEGQYRDQGYHIKAQQGFIYYCIDRKDPVWRGDEDKMDKIFASNPEMIGKPKVKILRVPWNVHSTIRTLYSNPEYGDIAHPLTGVDLDINRSGTKKDNTSYTVVASRHSTPLLAKNNGEPDYTVIKEVLTELSPLYEHPFYQLPTYEDGIAIWNGVPKAERRGVKKNADMSEHSSYQIPSSEQDVPQLGDSHVNWVTKVSSNEPGKAPFEPRTKEDLASWGGWEVDDIPACYSMEPDHTSEYCHECEVNKPCVASFLKKAAKYSINGPSIKPAGKPAMKSGKPQLTLEAPVETGEEVVREPGDDTELLEAYLEGKV